MARTPNQALTGDQVQHFLEPRRLGFHPTAPRERVVPERDARQARMPAEEQRRLGADGMGQERRRQAAVSGR